MKRKNKNWKQTHGLYLLIIYQIQIFQKNQEDLFSKKKYSYLIQLHATTFAYINRIPSKVLCNVLKWHYKDQFHIVRERKIHSLYKYFNDVHNGYNRRKKYFAYNVTHNKVLDLNLEVRKIEKTYDSQYT